MLKKRREQRLKEMLMVRIVVLAIEPGTYDVPVFTARRVIGQPSL